MADVKISALTALASSSMDFDGDVVAIVDVDAGVTKKITVDNLIYPININKGTGVITDLGTVTTADINGGTIDGAAIGGASASTGAFTTLSSTVTASQTALTVTSSQDASNKRGASFIMGGSNAGMDFGIFVDAGSNVTSGSVIKGISRHASFTGDLLTLDCDSSASGAVLINAKDAGTSKFKVLSTGATTINGNVTLSGSSTTRYYFLNSGGNGGVWQEGNHELRFGTNDTERMKIEGDGTVVMNGALQPAGNVTISGMITMAEGWKPYNGTANRLVLRDSNELNFFDTSGQADSDRELLYIQHMGTGSALNICHDELIVTKGTGSTFSGAIMQDGGDTFVHLGRGDSDFRLVLGSTNGNYSSGSSNAWNNIRAASGGLIYNVAESDDLHTWEQAGSSKMTLQDVSGSPQLTLKGTSDGSNCYLNFNDNAGADQQWRLHIDGGNGKFYYIDRDSTTVCYLTQDATDWSGFSDSRWKKNVSTISGGLDKINALRGVNYKWNVASKKSDTTTNRVGFIAQEVKDIIPEAIDETESPAHDGEKYYGITSTSLIPVMVEAIKELSNKVTELENK